MIAIPGYEELYSVTEDGEIYSHRTGKMKQPVKHKQGYRAVTLVARDGKISGYLVHRLIATALVPNPDSKPFVNHKDCDKANNSPSNLEWVTRSENMQHALKAGLLDGKLSRKGIQNGMHRINRLKRLRGDEAKGMR